MVQSRIRSVGLRRVAASALEQAGIPSLATTSTVGDRDRAWPPKKGLVDAFAYTEAGGRLELFTEPLTGPETAGIVREALLTTSVDPKGTLLNRLRLLVNIGERSSLDLVMPPGLDAGSCSSRWSGRHADPVAGGPVRSP